MYLNIYIYIYICIYIIYIYIYTQHSIHIYIYIHVIIISVSIYKFIGEGGRSTWEIIHASVRACERASVRASVRACERACVLACLRSCVFECGWVDQVLSWTRLVCRAIPPLALPFVSWCRTLSLFTFEIMFSLSLANYEIK